MQVPESAPTQIRQQTLFLVCLLSMLTYLDRVAFAAATPTIVSDLGLVSAADLRLAITAFAVAYAIFEIPSGWWGDRFGPRRILLRIVLWWSLFTALTGVVGLTVGGVVLGGVGLLALVRFLFGAGEAGAFPNIALTIQNWFPARERGFALGWVWMTSRIAGGLTPFIWMLLVAGTAYTPALMNWRVAFGLFGVIGLLWCLIFARRFRNTPTEHPDTNEAERTLIALGHDANTGHSGNVPWRKLFLSRNLIALCTMYSAATYAWFFIISYLPSCLETGFGVEPTSGIGSLYKGAPLWIGAAGCLLGGYWTDRLLRRGWSRRWARRGPGLLGLLLSAIAYGIAAVSSEAWMFAGMMAMAAFFTDLMMSSAWSTCQDIGGRHTGVVAGCMNTAGSVGAASAAWFSGVVLDRSLSARAASLGTSPAHLPESERIAALLDGYQLNMVIFAIIVAVGAGLWCLIDASRPIEDASSTME
ncbi:MAG: MFS transporter [Bacteroidales bacterium]|nr:MFS transporter [Bacteroidales bacterium]